MQQTQEDAYRYCLTLLSRRDYSVSELRNKLRKRGVCGSSIAAVLDKLTDLDYVNDERYAFNIALARVEVKFEGLVKIRRELLKRGIEETLAGKIIDRLGMEADMDKALSLALDKRIRIKGKPANEKELKNLQSYLKRKGFATDSILDVTSQYREKIFND